MMPRRRSARSRPSVDRHELRNKVLRPSPHLGYPEDRIGVHLMVCEAYRQAELFFRRAV